MATCAYQLVSIGVEGEPNFDSSGEPIASGGIIELANARWGRKIIKMRQDIVLETELGRRWIFEQFDRQTYAFTFRCTPDDLELFRTLDEAVGGQRDPFLFYPFFDVDPSLAIFVRKTPEFDEGTEQPGVLDSAIERIIDYTLTVSEEPTGEEVT